MTHDQPPAPATAGTEHPSIRLKNHLSFTVLSLLTLLLMYSLLRLALLVYNHEQIGGASLGDLAEAFFNGLRFDLRLAVCICLPLLLVLASRRAMQARRLMCGWLTVAASLTLFLGLIELDFYREFNQRLNGLVFQYLKEDPKTVLNMLWYGFPVLRYLLAWALASAALAWVFRWISQRHQSSPPKGQIPPLSTSGEGPGVRFVTPLSERLPIRLAVLALCLLLAILGARGTLRQGPPLRWGDAFTTESVFANQLGLNGTLSLISAAQAQFFGRRHQAWQGSQAYPEALDIVRHMLLTGHDTLLAEERAAVLRTTTPPTEKTLAVKNVVLIIMESLAGRHVGVLGGGDITPNFDRLAGEGLLFTRFFSNGTHTHQGMFASISCFPNLPAFEYLMQTPEGNNDFSGLPALLKPRGFDNLYVYNGDFAWDNQSGFFGKQGVSNFIGRFDFVDPVVFDPTWGVSDQDMFDRAAAELRQRQNGKPFYAILQTISNHTPYALPAQLPVAPVSGYGSLDQHLTAMRYADWALGRFFDQIRDQPFYKETLFVIVGDHGFGSGEQLTEMNLARFNVPLLLLAPGIREKFGAVRDTVGSQVDIVPTIMGRLGGPTRHQCWGRDLLTLPADDPGFGVIKPSGSEQIVALIRDNEILIEAKGQASRLYRYHLWAAPQVTEINDDNARQALREQLDAYLQVATKSLLNNTAGPQ
ncbi:MAG: LTA synthase family protein [Betaproteobacteria bacterium]|nr:LTA synthase family protein [Betaproteobacteria bacterium]MCL2885681.1 LTA synthase family protein [Betaproteobacteria bacterium]